MKNISLLLIFLLLLQSCNVYNIPTSVENAVAADKKVKVITADNQKYKFKRLENKNNRLIGITKLRSVTANKMAGVPGEIDGKYLKIDLSNVDIEGIKLHNETGSIVLTVVAIAGALVVAWLTVFLIGFSQAEIWPSGTGSE